VPVRHDTLAAGRWQQFTICEQLGHVGSEVSRTKNAAGNEARFWSAAARAFELLDLTIGDPRWKSRLRELLRAREFLADAILGGHVYRTSMDDMDRYFFQFARAARPSDANDRALANR
jgi:hypothetical protein